MPTWDDEGRKRVPPGTRHTIRDTFWPQRHGKWWNYDANAHRPKTEELYADFHIGVDMVKAQAKLEQVEAIAQAAVDRAAAADRRATTISGAVAIAASFTLGGGALVLDGTKIPNADVRRWLALVLCFTTALFVLSAVYALRALVATRTWNWSDPHDLRPDVNTQYERLGRRAAGLLHDFAGNWEISDLKNRNVDLALRCLIAALFGIAALAGLVAAYAI